MNPVDIFLSYAHEDEERALVVAEALRDCGWTIWWDKNLPAGRGYRDVIADALANARCVVVLWSHASIRSDWVHDEAELGKQEHRLVPVFIDQVVAPLGFMSIQGHQLPGLPSALPAPALAALNQSIAALVGSPGGAAAQPTPGINLASPVLVPSHARSATPMTASGAPARDRRTPWALKGWRPLLAAAFVVTLALAAWATYLKVFRHDPAGFLALGQPEEAAPVYTSLAPMPTPLSMVSGTAVRGVFMVAGGHDGTRDGNEFSAYHPESNTWTALQPLPDWRYQSSGAVAMRGRLYLVGGWDNRQGSRLPHSEVYEYDPVPGTWSIASRMPTLSAGGASGVMNGMLYVLTSQNGHSDPPCVHTLHVWNPLDDTWKELKGSTVVHVTPASGVIANKLYIAGGGDGLGGTTDVLEAYDPATNAWTVLAPMPEPRNGAAGAVIDGLFYVFGGETESGVTNAVSVYDPETNAWSRSAPLPTPRTTMACGAIGNTAFLAGGSNASGTLNSLVSMRTHPPGHRAR